MGVKREIHQFHRFLLIISIMGDSHFYHFFKFNRSFLIRIKRTTNMFRNKFSTFPSPQIHFRIIIINNNNNDNKTCDMKYIRNIVTDRYYPNSPRIGGAKIFPNEKRLKKREKKPRLFYSNNNRNIYE